MMDITDNNKQSILSAVTSLAKSPGWAVLKKYMQERITEEEKSIFSDIGANSDTKYTDNDIAKVRRQEIMFFLGLPENIARECQENKPSDNNDDPYGPSTVIEDSKNQDGEVYN